MDDTKLKVSMKDLWTEEGEMRVMLHDGGNGLDRDIILACAKTATTARNKAISKLKTIIKKLENMDK